MECPANESGEIAIRGSNLLTHYYKNPQATESAFTNGWFRTGDLGRKDDDGYLFITGRLKELIIRGGENIAPREIDDVLYRHESILEAAAVGVDDDNYGQEVVACVVVRDGFSCSEQELKDFCTTAIGAYKTPKIIYFMDDLPKGPSGKIMRLKLPELIASL
jgi:acyl-CoA synthetase (AMP-forming)/AMP-acid ligase II